MKAGEKDETASSVSSAEVVHHCDESFESGEVICEEVVASESSSSTHIQLIHGATSIQGIQVQNIATDDGFLGHLTESQVVNLQVQLPTGQFVLQAVQITPVQPLSDFLLERLQKSCPKSDDLTGAESSSAAQDSEEVGKSRRACTCSNCRQPGKVYNKSRQLVHVCDMEGCETTFLKTSHLRSHQRTHFGFKPYICDVAACAKAFSRHDQLLRHLRVHTQKKAFLCLHCLKGFSRKDHMSKHIRAAHMEDPASSETDTHAHSSPR